MEESKDQKYVTAEQETKNPRINTSEPAGAENDEPSSAGTSALMSAVEKFWLFELFALLVSIIGLVAVVITLKLTDGQKMPQWQLKAPNGKSSTITINAILSIFSTMVKSTVLIPVGAAMGELKWMWFTNGRLLSDIQVFESAARGPLGSVIMLWKLRGRSLACLGAIIVIGSLALDFSFQQLVTYPYQPTPVGVATIPRTNSYSAFRTGALTGVKSPEIPMIAAMYKGIYSTNNTFFPVPGCPSGNCTWPEQYTSLGICSKCYSTTDQLNKTCSTFNYTSTDENNISRVVGNPIPYCNYTMDSGQAILGYNGTDANGNLPIVTKIIDSSSFAASNRTYFGNPSIAAHLSHFSVLRASWISRSDGENEQARNWNSLEDVNATECGLDYCVIKYEGTEAQGIFTERVIDTFVNTTGLDVAQGIVINPPKEFTNKSDENENNVYFVEPFTAIAMSIGLFQTHSQPPAQVWDGIYEAGVATETESSTFLSILRFLDDAGLNDTMTSVAAALTQRIRTAPHESGTSPGLGPTALGTVLQDVPHVQVRWAWITLPALILGLSALFLVATMAVSKKEGASMLWKGNALAPFYHPLTKDNRDRLGGATSAKHFEKMAENVKVKWQETESGGRFVPA